MALVAELRVDKERVFVLLDLPVDLLLCHGLHPAPDRTGCVIAEFHADLFCKGHIVKQNVAHAAHPAQNATLHAPHLLIRHGGAGKVANKLHKGGIMALCGKELAFEAVPHDHVRVVLRAVDALIDGQIQFAEVQTNAAVRLHHGQRERQAVILQRPQEPDALTVCQKDDEHTVAVRLVEIAHFLLDIRPVERGAGEINVRDGREGRGQLARKRLLPGDDPRKNRLIAAGHQAKQTDLRFPHVFPSCYRYHSFISA